MKVVKLEDCINEIKSLDNNGCITRSTNHVCEDMRKEVKEFEAIPIPEFIIATYGDIIKRLLNPYKIYENEYTVHVYMTEKDFWEGNYQMNCDADWWNAPFKKDCIPNEYDFSEEN